MNVRTRMPGCASLLLAALVAAAPFGTAFAADAGPAPGAPVPSFKADVEEYFTAPLHWDASEWVWFAGSLAVIAGSHHYDEQVRTHFVDKEGPTDGSNQKDFQDIAPTIAVIAGTWFFAGLSYSDAGHQEAWRMVEAAGLSGVTAYALKFAAGREDPYQTSDPNSWREGGSSFPSLHSTVAFAVGTVLAESGGDDYRWVRRVLGYGLGVATSYERLKHNAHWLSDTVAGSALGIATGRFAVNRDRGNPTLTGWSVTPVSGGALLSYSMTLN
jgi:membrane-associated phospholipid phosphatase